MLQHMKDEELMVESTERRPERSPENACSGEEDSQPKAPSAIVSDLSYAQPAAQVSERQGDNTGRLRHRQCPGCLHPTGARPTRLPVKHPAQRLVRRGAAARGTRPAPWSVSR